MDITDGVQVDNDIRDFTKSADKVEGGGEERESERAEDRT